MIFAVYLIPLMLALALITWVYFDATELGKPAIPWAIAQPMLWWLFFLPLILYAIFRENGPHRSVPPGGARRQAVYILSFVGYSTMAYGLSAVLGAAFVRLSTDIGDTAWREIVSSSVAAIVIGGAIWGAAWLQAEPRLHALSSGQEFRATFYLHRTYLYTVMGINGVILAVLGLWLIAGFVSTVSAAGDVDAEAWTWTGGPILVSLISLILHYSVYLRSDRYQALLGRFEGIPAPPMLGLPVAAGVAASVGASGGTGRFCPKLRRTGVWWRGVLRVLRVPAGDAGHGICRQGLKAGGARLIGPGTC